MQKKNFFGNTILNAAEEVVAITGCCPYHYLGCDDTELNEKLDEFVLTYLPWCDRPKCMKIPGRCMSEHKHTTQLEAWKYCWVEYWSGKKRCIPPAWNKTDNLEKIEHPNVPKSVLDGEYSAGEVCPKCGDGALIRRESARGPFWGCTEFPECKLIIPIKEKKKEKEPF